MRVLPYTALSWWPFKKASQTHIANRTTQLRHSGCTARACVSQTEPSYTSEPVQSYSSRAYAPPFRRPEIDVTRATKQHRHRLRLLQRRLTRRRLRLSQFLRNSAIIADAITSSLVTVCRVGWTSTKRPRVHHTPELLASLPVYPRCSSLSASLKSCQVMGALNTQLPKPPTSCRDGGPAIAYHRSHFRSLMAGLK